MAVYSVPNLRLFRPRSMSWQLMGNVSFNRSPTNGVITTSENPGDPWSIRMEYGVHYSADRRRLAGFYNRFRGPGHIMRCHNLDQPEPAGTMRGAPTVQSTVAFGASQMFIVTSAGATLKQGDMFGVISSFGYPLLMQVAEDTVAGGIGSMTVDLTAPVRYAIAGGSPIIWQRPYADFLLLTAPIIPFEPKICPPFTIEAVEFLR